MKSRFAFEFTVRKMLRENSKLYFWTFTFREVHSLKAAMGFWNEFLTLLKRKLHFRGVRVLELHDEHGCHFHVITNRRFPIRTILGLSKRYGFGRMDVRSVPDVSRAIGYLCKYLSKRRAPCLKRVRLWAAFGDVERTRVADIVVDSPFVRVLRAVMGSASPDELLHPSAVIPRRFKRTFFKALPIAWAKYMAEFDPKFWERQQRWETLRFNGVCPLSALWFEPSPEFDLVEAV